MTDVLPGTYKITINATNFGTSIHDGVMVLANTVVRVDSTLAVAGKVETITISGAAPVLQTDRADVHSNLNMTELENLPLNSDEGRNFQIPVQDGAWVQHADHYQFRRGQPATVDDGLCQWDLEPGQHDSRGRRNRLVSVVARERRVRAAGRLD